MKKVLGVIPARLHSTRLPRKLLADIGGRPLIWYTIQQAKRAKSLDEIVVATDSPEILDVAIEAGVTGIMTSSRHKSGSDRVAEAVTKFTRFVPDAIVNVQGDEPIISPSAIDAVAKILISDSAVLMATVAAPFENFAEVAKPNCVKVVLDKNGDALYFSRSPIPFPRNEYRKYLKHIGIFGFQSRFLPVYLKLRQTSLELAEGLEQLRVLEHGYRIRVGVGKFIHHSVDVPEDLEYIRSYLSSKGI
jgi:3-deoxy-manno-octulosonate cytidylyltransferase (CMP-KDO synthetase)